MLTFAQALPIDAILPQLLDALSRVARLVLVAPPGAGKTTRVPLALLDAQWRGDGRILVLSPRRLAARAAAERMAATLGEAVGQTVGYRVRFEQKVSSATRIEVLTEGVFTRAIQRDPDLTGVAAVLFDEAHERSLEGDLGLALALDAQAALRPDLRLLPMSATLDGARVARLLGDAPVIRSAGRMFPVETRYRPRQAESRLEADISEAIVATLGQERGSLLVFLPGAAEINRVADMVTDRAAAAGATVHPLYGALEGSAQRAAIAPCLPGERKVVLATSIAETSLTIEGVRVVIDSGLARRPRFDPAIGLTRLTTERASQAAVEQRRGRAGRLEPGLCIRLWDEGQTRALPPFDPPEILEADLSGLLLDLALWGVNDPLSLRWLDPPPAASSAQARTLLTELGALDADGRITGHGRAIAGLPLPPRLAHMLLTSAAQGDALLAATIALIVAERGLGGADSDLRHRLRILERDRSPRGRSAREMAHRWVRLCGAVPEPIDPERAGVVLARAFPDRVARARGPGGPWLMANGRAAGIAADDPLGRSPWLAIAEASGRADRAAILLAAPLDQATVEAEFTSRISRAAEVAFDPRTGSVRAFERVMLGAIELRQSIVARPDPAHVLQAMLGALREHGLDLLCWTDGLRAWRSRVDYLRQAVAPHSPWPEMTDAALLGELEQWLAPWLAGHTRLDTLAADDLSAALASRLSPTQQRLMPSLAPSHFATPAGASHRIDYAADGGPAVEVRVQELFGLDEHPTVLDGRAPLTLVLLSPAHRPIQTTRDLPGFWRGSWAEVKTEMKGRYPKHVWPDHPAKTAATLRAKPRGQ